MAQKQVHELITSTLELGGMDKPKAKLGADILSRHLKLKHPTPKEEKGNDE